MMRRLLPLVALLLLAGCSPETVSVPGRSVQQPETTPEGWRASQVWQLTELSPGCWFHLSTVSVGDVLNLHLYTNVVSVDGNHIAAPNAKDIPSDKVTQAVLTEYWRGSSEVRYELVYPMVRRETP